MTGHPAKKVIWTRETVRSIAIPVGVSIVPLLLLNLWFCGRAEDHLQCVRKSVPFWAAALFLVAGLLALRLVWKLVTWASDLSGTARFVVYTRLWYSRRARLGRCS